MNGDMSIKGSYLETKTNQQQEGQQQAAPMMDGMMMAGGPMRPGMDPMAMGMGLGRPGMMAGEGMMGPMGQQQQQVPGSPMSVPQLKVRAMAEVSLLSVSVETPAQAEDTTGNAGTSETGSASAEGSAVSAGTASATSGTQANTPAKAEATKE